MKSAIGSVFKFLSKGMLFLTVIALVNRIIKNLCQYHKIVQGYAAKYLFH